MRSLGVASAAALLSGLAIAFLALAFEPAWQIKDDVYYAMLGDGYGMVARPAGELPFMHPLIGQAVGGIRALTGHFAYAIFLYLCLWAGAAAIAYRFLAARGWPAAIACVAAAVAPFVLLPQYTAVAGFLVASAAVLWTAGPARPPAAPVWIYGLALILLAALLRVEMAVLAALCLAPVAIDDAASRGWLTRARAFQVALGTVAVLAGVYLTRELLGDPRMVELYGGYPSRVTLLDYGYGPALATLGAALPQGFTENDLDLLNHWFFAYPPIVEASTLNALIERVPFSAIVRMRLSGARSFVLDLPGTLFFWYTLAAIALAWVSRRRTGLAVGVALSVCAAAAFALLGKPFPERVAIGIAVGLFLLAALTARDDLPTPRGALRARVLAALLLLPAAWTVGADRLALLRASRLLEQDLAVLRGSQAVYSWANGLPLRAAFRPFSIPADLPPLVFLGTAYLLPQVAEEERSRDCGGFMACLIGGAPVRLLASDAQIRRLDTLLRERHGKTLSIVAKTSTASFSLYEIRALELQPRRASGPG